MTQYRSKSKGHKDKDPGLELSVGQVLAAAGATVVGAVIAKLLDLWGTVAGTAILSVCSSIGAVLILRAMRRTGERIRSQLAAMSPAVQGRARTTVTVHPDSVSATAKIPDADRLRSLRGDTVDIAAPDQGPPEGHVTRTQSRRRTLAAILVSSVLVFGLTLGTLYLLGAFTGDPGRFISGTDPKTSISETRIEDDPAESATGEDAPATTEAPAQEPSASPSESPSETATPSGEPSTDTGQGAEETASPDPAEADATPSEDATAG